MDSLTPTPSPISASSSPELPTRLLTPEDYMPEPVEGLIGEEKFTDEIPVHPYAAKPWGYYTTGAVVLVAAIVVAILSSRS